MLEKKYRLESADAHPRPSRRQGPHAVQAASYALAAAAVALRPWRPLECLAFIVAVSVVEYALVGSPEGFGVMMPALVASYSVARWEARRPARWGLVLVLVLGVAWVGFDPMDPLGALAAPACSGCPQG